MTRRWCR